MSSAKPLKIPAASPSKPNSASIPTPTNEKPSAPPPPSSSGASNPSDITSPHELTAFVNTISSLSPYMCAHKTSIYWQISLIQLALYVWVCETYIFLSPNRWRRY